MCISTHLEALKMKEMQYVRTSRARAAWIKLDSTAQRIIVTSLDEKRILHIINCETAKDMCKHLESVYEQKSECTSIHMLLQQCYSYQKEPGNDIATHIVKLENLAHRLQTLGEKIPNQMIISKILMTLPPSFKYFISAWESTQPSEKTLTNLISRFTIEETWTETEERAENIAFIANKKAKQKHQIGCRKRKAATPNEKYTEKKGEALIGAMSAKYNLEIFSDSWHMDSSAAENMSNCRK
ncbi:uncharacterized protein LOC133667592 [Apis cerana]|uniref:uncharacterized protein LOC133667592 n=1 Tax=Apis cerana TaxID=7461 RepID=UPI002B22E37B|nr:uncharacterized protein LOC133667592 [Apis cerana]